MKAIYFSSYGPVADLQLNEIDTPQAAKGEVLVQIKAAAINDYDWSMVRGRPRLYRLLFGWRKPRLPVPGMELAGIISAVGEGAERFKVGDEVYGDISEYKIGGCFAQYLAVNEKALELKPKELSFEQAVTLPHAGGLALQALVDKGKIQAGDRILINGAGGGVGSLGLQLAQQYSQEVDGVDTGEKLVAMRELGFRQVIDYKQEDFTRNGKRYDLIIDTKTNRSPFAYLRALQPKGRYMTVGGTIGRLLQLALLGGLIRLFTGKRLKVVALKSNKDLDYLGQLMVAGKLKAPIDGPYPLAELPQRLQYFGEGLHHGKVVITLPEIE